MVLTIILKDILVMAKKLNKLSIRGRRQRYSRPKVARLAAASSTIRGRESITSY